MHYTFTLNINEAQYNQGTQAIFHSVMLVYLSVMHYTKCLLNKGFIKTNENEKQ